LAECSHCHDRKTIHVNDVKAEPSKVVAGIGVGAGVVLTAAFWQLGFIAGLSLSLPVIVYATQQKAAATFNGYKIRPMK